MGWDWVTSHSKNDYDQADYPDSLTPWYDWLWMLPVGLIGLMVFMPILMVLMVVGAVWHDFGPHVQRLTAGLTRAQLLRRLGLLLGAVLAAGLGWAWLSRLPAPLRQSAPESAPLQGVAPAGSMMDAVDGPVTVPGPPLEPIPTVVPVAWSLLRECESPDGATVGQTLGRSQASGAEVHGQFGAVGQTPWPAQAGTVSYAGLALPATAALTLQVRYSKFSSASVPVEVFLDGEPTPRAAFLPDDQGDWERFAWTRPLRLGAVTAGTHTLTFATAGQEYGAADLDQFVLTAGEPAWPFAACDRQPLAEWRQPGTYIFRNIDENGQVTVSEERLTGPASPAPDLCAGADPFRAARDFGALLAEPPSVGARGEVRACGFYGGWASVTVLGWEPTATLLDRAPAVRVATERGYLVLAANHNDPAVHLNTQEWYVCGLGLVRSSTTGTVTYQGRSRPTHAEMELLSFTPLTAAGPEP